MVLLSESSGAQASFLASSSLGCPRLRGSTWLTTVSTLQLMESWVGTLIPFNGKEIALVISTHIPLAGRGSHGND